MNTALRLINLMAVVLVCIVIQRGAAGDDQGVAYEVGRWIGAALLCIAPLLTVLALRRQASSGLRTTAVVLCSAALLLFVSVAVLAVVRRQQMLPALVGSALFSLLCGFNIWRLRTFGRDEFLDDDEETRSWFPIRYWRGELPLGTTFWAGGALLLLIQFLLFALFGMLANAVSLRAGAWLILSAFTFTTLLVAWQAVGVWRAATRSSRQGSPFWPLVARTSVVTGLLVFAGMSVQLLWIPLREHALVAVGRDPLPPLEARLTTEDSVLLLHGTFGSGSAGRVRRLLDQSDSIRLVALSSPGGRLREASEIAQLVRDRKLDTYVDTRCESACTFVFLAGKDRAATPNARIGFHRPSFAGISPVGFDPATESMLDTYRRAGVPGGFLDKVAATHPSKMWYPSAKELEEAGVINRVSLGGETSALGFLALNSKKDLETAFRNVPMMAAMENHFPGTIAAAVQAAWMERTQGGIDSAVANAARQVVSERYPRILASADDASLDLFASVMVEQMQAASAVSTEACGLLLEGQLNIAQVLSPELVQREQDWALGVLKADQLLQREPVDPGVFQRTMASAAEVLPQEVIDVVSAPGQYQDQPKKRCDATIALYARILELPDAERHLVLRGMFQPGTP